jgi:hypothetical protein
MIEIRGEQVGRTRQQGCRQPPMVEGSECHQFRVLRLLGEGASVADIGESWSVTVGT